MRRGSDIVGVAACAACALMSSSVRLLADDYPLAGQTGVTVTGVIGSVDSHRDRITVTDDENRTYTIDTYDADIGLTSSSKHADTGDLMGGMRVKATGRMLASNLLAAERVIVMPLNSPPAPTKPPAVALPPGSLTCRGTIVTTSSDARSFVLRIADHTRTVHLSDTTDLSSLVGSQGAASPFVAGERVTVGGFLRSDGSIDADIITSAQTIDVSVTAPPSPASVPPAHPVAPPKTSPVHAHVLSHLLTGTVSSTSTEFQRDIKVRVNGQREVPVHVPKDIPILRDGQPISVHDLWKDDEVRIYGTWNSGGFTASRIDVAGFDTTPSGPP